MTRGARRGQLTAASEVAAAARGRDGVLVETDGRTFFDPVPRRPGDARGGAGSAPGMNDAGPCEHVFAESTRGRRCARCHVPAPDGRAYLRAVRDLLGVARAMQEHRPHRELARVVVDLAAAFDALAEGRDGTRLAEDACGRLGEHVQLTDGAQPLVQAAARRVVEAGRGRR